MLKRNLCWVKDRDAHKKKQEKIMPPTNTKANYKRDCLVIIVQFCFLLHLTSLPSLYRFLCKLLSSFETMYELCGGDDDVQKSWWKESSTWCFVLIDNRADDDNIISEATRWWSTVLESWSFLKPWRWNERQDPRIQLVKTSQVNEDG